MPPLSCRRGLFAFLAIALLVAAPAKPVQADDDASAAITALLQEFLAQNSDPAQHERFWAHDLVYTSSAGIVRTKPEIMDSVTKAAVATTDSAIAAPMPVYSAEDILVRMHGSTALLTFRLVAQNPDGTTLTFRNSGTFLLRAGQWQVVTWQATRLPSRE